MSRLLRWHCGVELETNGGETKWFWSVLMTDDEAVAMCNQLTAYGFKACIATDNYVANKQDRPREGA